MDWKPARRRARRTPTAAMDAAAPHEREPHANAPHANASHEREPHIAPPAGQAPHASQPSAVWMMGAPTIPLRSLVLAFSCLLIPVIATVYFPESADEYQMLLWLLALVPAFLLAYYRGWAGVATALGAGMAVMSLAQAALLLTGRHVPDWPLLFAFVSAYILIALGLGLFSEMLHRERERAERLALSDELTGTPNRRYLRLFLDTEFAAARRGRRLVVVLFDLDAFKSFNDHWGHAAGDEALVVFSRALVRHTRAMNLAGRYGGEEFLAILSASDVAGALVFVDRVTHELRRARGDLGDLLTVSAGVAAYRPEMAGVAELLESADRALYAAKRAGGDTARVFQGGGRSLETIA